MKNNRQAAILELIEKKEIETQEELVRELLSLGYMATQATVSRDIRYLHLVKVSNLNGGYKYASANQAENEVLSERFVKLFVNSVLSIAYANNIIVIKTLAGSANAAAEAVDGMKWPEVLGTMAGDNTIMVVVRTNEETEQIAQRLEGLLKD